MRGKLEPALMAAGGVVCFIGMIEGWTTLSLSWNGRIAAIGELQGSPLAISGAGLLVVAGFLLAWQNKERRASAGGLGVAAAAIVLLSVVLAYTNQHGIDAIAPDGTSTENFRAQVDQLIARGASLQVDRSVGLYLSLVGGILGLVGGGLTIALRRPRLLRPRRVPKTRSAGAA
jgi:hypothetical protein